MAYSVNIIYMSCSSRIISEMPPPPSPFPVPNYISKCLGECVPSIPSREATVHHGRCTSRTGVNSSRKELAPLKHVPPPGQHPLEMVTLLRKRTRSHTSRFLSLEEAQPAQTLRTLQPWTKMSLMRRKSWPY